ncbi:pheromone-binding protein Gp-9-like [Nylanderia fulva]|uniref:pheromone-binding protein Gp-9-like n=1 Tax=Nylanderia fulva TaxID=613905 RepID=UPI0010FB333F|nr:pheromone-binding protein Gp-9-like [Nylanderia fulva]
MKRGFYVIVFAFIPAILARIPNVNKKVGSHLQEYSTCLTQIDITENDIYTVGDLIHDRYKESENEEKVKKNGCLVHCLLQKQNLIEELDLNVEKLHTELTKKTNAQPGDNVHKALDECIEKVKDITDKCEKSFAL